MCVCMCRGGVQVCVCAYFYMQQSVPQQVQNLEANMNGLISQDTSGMWTVLLSFVNTARLLIL